MKNNQLEKNGGINHNSTVSHFIKTVIGQPAQWLIEAAVSISLDYSMLSHETTTELIGHSIKRHGDQKTHGAATITEKDFEHIPDIIKTPDYAVIGAIRKESLFNAYAKTITGKTYLYFEEVLNSRKNKALRGKTLYKITRTLSLDEFLKNVSRNGKTDISKAYVFNSQKNAQTAGGHPGG